MGFEINSEEFEVAEENKTSTIHYDILDVKKQMAFLIDRYQQRIKGVERRRKNLLQTAGIFGSVTAGLILLAVIMGIMSNPVFGIWAVMLFLGLGVFVSIRTIRVLWSYAVHKEIIPKRVYTLNEEEQLLRYLLKQLEDDGERLEKFLEQEPLDEEAVRQLLGEIRPQLTEDEHRADYLYGESDRL